MSAKVIIFPEALDPRDKKVLVKFPGGTRQPQEGLIGPGVTAWDLMQKFGIDAGDYDLNTSGSNRFIKKSDSLYPHIQNGGSLYVTSKIDAGT